MSTHDPVLVATTPERVPTSTPPKRLRSHLPLFSDACAWGMLRACASIIAIVCSACAARLPSRTGWRRRRA